MDDGVGRLTRWRVQGRSRYDPFRGPKGPPAPKAAGGGETSLLLAGLFGAVAACSPREAPAPVEAAVAAEVRHDGAVRFADEQRPVASFVMHDPQLDLVVQCQLKRDADVAAGRDAALCFDPARRAAATIKVLRVDVFDLGPGGRRAMASVIPALAAAGDGTHFLVERSGTPYQLLDLAHAARRGGELRPDEVRVICVLPGDWRPLLADLQVLFPGARQDVVRHAAPMPPAPAPPAPSPPDAPTPPPPPGAAP